MYAYKLNTDGEDQSESAHKYHEDENKKTLNCLAIAGAKYTPQEGYKCYIDIAVDDACKALRTIGAENKRLREALEDLVGIIDTDDFNIAIIGHAEVRKSPGRHRRREVNRSIEDQIVLAGVLATYAHAGQFRRDGKTPYIEHPRRVAAKLEGKAKVVALLHDVCEDTDVTFASIEDLFDREVVEAVKAMTKSIFDSYPGYLARLKENALAVEVKLGDIDDNLNGPDAAPSDKQRAKYERAIDYLQR